MFVQIAIIKFLELIQLLQKCLPLDITVHDMIQDTNIVTFNLLLNLKNMDA